MGSCNIIPMIAKFVKIQGERGPIEFRTKDFPSHTLMERLKKHLSEGHGFNSHSGQ